jgi:hypothetical protein
MNTKNKTVTGERIPARDKYTLGPNCDSGCLDQGVRVCEHGKGNAPRVYVEHQAIEVVGNDGKRHQLWARTAMDAYKDATRWSYRHGGLDEVLLMIPRDDDEGCWERAKRVNFSRQCDLQLIAKLNAI